MVLMSSESNTATLESNTVHDMIAWEVIVGSEKG